MQTGELLLIARETINRVWYCFAKAPTMLPFRSREKRRATRWSATSIPGAMAGSRCMCAALASPSSSSSAPFAEKPISCSMAARRRHWRATRSNVRERFAPVVAEATTQLRAPHVPRSLQRKDYHIVPCPPERLIAFGTARCLPFRIGPEGPLWVKPAPRGAVATRPLRRRKRNSKRHSTMSQSCQRQTSRRLIRSLHRRGRVAMRGLSDRAPWRS
jgi:hypothetical protein